MNKNQVNDAVFEALLRQVVIDKYHAEVNDIPSNDELAKTISFSHKFELRMKKLLAHERRTEFLKITFSYSRKVAAFFLISISILFGILLLSPEVRAAVGKTIVEWYEKFTSFSFENEDAPIENKDWYPGYLPDGYFESSTDKLGRTTNIVFANEVGEIIRFSYRSEDNTSNLSVDNENHTIEDILINGNEAYSANAVSEEFENGVVWITDGYKIDIWSKLPLTEIKKVAESVSEKE